MGQIRMISPAGYIQWVPKFIVFSMMLEYGYSIISCYNKDK